MGRKTKMVHSGQVAAARYYAPSDCYLETLVVDHTGLHMVYVQTPEGQCDSEQVSIPTARAWMKKHKLGGLDTALVKAVAEWSDSD